MNENKNNEILNDKNLSQSVQPADGNFSDQADFNGVLGDSLDSKKTSVSKKDRPQNKNLISLATRTKEERQAIGRKGGLKSAENRKARKTMKESLLAMLSMELSEKKLRDMGVDIESLNGDYTMQGALLSAMLREAVNGSEKAMALVRDTIGEAPVTKTENVTEVITKEDTDLMNDIKRTLIG